MEITGEIIYMFKDCPRPPNGWFGCYFRPDNGYEWSVNVSSRGTLTLFGCTNISLVNRMRISADIEPDPKKGPTDYNATKISVLTDTFSSMLAYFSSKDLGNGDAFDGDEIIEMYNKWDEDTFATIIRTPSLLNSMGFNDTQKSLLIAAASKSCPSDVENELRDLIPWASNKLIDHLIETFKGNIINRLKADPYALYFDPDVRGKSRVMFKNVDELAIKLDIPRNSPLCIRSHLRYVVRTMLESSKDCYLNLSNDRVYDIILDSTISSIDSPAVTRKEIGDELKKVPEFTITNANNFYQLYETHTFEAEQNCYDTIAKLVTDPPIKRCGSKALVIELIKEYEMDNGITLSQEQKDAVLTAVNSNISIINGGPGRGKTAIINCILYVCRRVFNYVAPVLATPTGKASKRMKDSIDPAYADNVNTIAHYMYTKAGCFFKNTIVIVDESSMVDIYMASFLLSSLDNSKIIFVGDIHQLPSIDTGSFFSDICSLDCIPRATLTKCYRTNAPLITDNADKINNGVFAKGLKYDFDTYSLYPQTADDESFANDIMSEYKNHLNNGLGVNDISVICPVNKGAAGVLNMNIQIQNYLNPEQTLPANIQSNNGILRVIKRGVPILSTRYVATRDNWTRLRIEDKIMYTVNDGSILGKDLSTGKEICGLANGETGILMEYRQDVTDSDNDYIIMQTEDNKEYYIPADCFDNIILAYASTVHKAQGSEYDAVIVSMPCAMANYPPSMDFASRNLLYTAVTRAKNAVSIFGSEDSINRCISTLPRKRISLMNYHIEEKVYNALYLKFTDTNYQGHIITPDERRALILGKTVTFPDCSIQGWMKSRNVKWTIDLYNSEDEYSLESTES